MHLAFLTSEYPHPRTEPAAGIGTSMKNMVIELVKREVTISLFVYNQKEDAVFTEGGIKFHLIKQRKFKLFGWYLHRKFLQNYINKYIAVDQINAIEAPDWTGITAFMKLNCPLVIRFHGSDSYFCNLENRPQKKKNFWFEKTALDGADHLLSVSEFTAKKTSEIFNLKQEIHVIPNSVDIKMFTPKKPAHNSGTLLYFGSIIRKKGVLELASIFNRVHQKDPRVQLIMTGRDVADIRTGSSSRLLFEEILTESARTQVVWKGNLSYSEVIAELQKAAVVALPSFAEALPMTWLEAMAMENALVTSNIGWAKEVMIEGETGFMVHPEDHDMYAEKILKFLNDPAMAQQLGKAARQRVLEKFSTEVVVEENLKFYEGIVRRI